MSNPGLHRPAGLSPAAGRRRRHRRRADGPAARGPRQHRSRRRPLPAGDGGTGAPRRGQRTTHDAGRQRLLHPRHRRGLPPAGCPFLHHRSAARQPAEPHRGHTGGGLDAGPLLDGRRRRRGGDQLHPLSKRARRRTGAAHRPEGEAHARLSTGPVGHLQLSRLHHRPGWRHPGSRGRPSPISRPTIAATPRSRMPSATSSTAWVSTISRPAVSPPTALGWRSRRLLTTWRAGRRASVWASRW